MDVVSVCPLRVASLRWRGRRTGEVLTVVAKATYRLLPGTCTLAEEQEDPSEHENHWDDDENRSLHAPADLVPWKPRPEVTLVGNAFAPRGEPVQRLVARLIVGSVDKVIVIHGERSFSHEGTLRDGARFSRMPLRWERAAGGPETKNPVGIARTMDARGATLLPNLEPLNANVTRPDQHIDPVGFGPIGLDWPSRRERIARAGGRWSPSEPMPEALDPLYFMSAPFDQHLDELRPNERIVLENLHPEHPRLVTSLPGYEARAFVDRGSRGVSDLPMSGDTLWIDTDRSICTLTFRAQIALEDRAEGRVVIAMEMLGRPLAWTDVEATLRRKRASPSSPISQATSPMSEDGEKTEHRPPPPKRSNTMPFAIGPQRWPSWLPRPDGEPAPQPASTDTTATIDTPIPREAIDAAIAKAAAERAAVAGPAWFREPNASQPEIIVSPAAPAAVIAPPGPVFGAPAPAVVAPPAPVFGAPAPAIIAPPLPVFGTPAPAVVAPPAPVFAPQPAPIFAPPAEVITPQPAARPMLSLASPMSLPLQAISTPSSPTPAPSIKPSRPPPLASKSQPAPALDAALRGVAAASNAAAATSKEPSDPVENSPRARPSPVRDPARDHVDLIWFDADAVPRIRADRDLGEGAQKSSSVVWLKGDAPAREAQEVKDRRDLLAVLSRIAPLDEAGLARTAGDAYREDGTFTAPLALVGGEIALAFDEIEALRATITVVSSFLGNDKKLRETVDAAESALKAAWPLPADIAEGLTRRVEEAFLQGQRQVAPGYLEGSVEKILLQGRRYQKKTLFGEPRIRALLSFGGSASPIPTYLPDAIASKLPLFRRFKSRMIVEIRPQEDQYESHADALLVLALSRLVRRAS